MRHMLRSNDYPLLESMTTIKRSLLYYCYGDVENESTRGSLVYLLPSIPTHGAVLQSEAKAVVATFGLFFACFVWCGQALLHSRQVDRRIQPLGNVSAKKLQDASGDG